MSNLENIFDQVISIPNLRLANQHAMKGKRYNRFATGFNYDLMSSLLLLQKQLLSQTYHPEDYRHKIILEPKVRSIEAPSYRDRIVHHAIYQYLNPFYEKYFIKDSYACRQDKGVHTAAKRVQSFLRSNHENQYVCQIDVSKYYASINHNRLVELLAGKINDRKLIKLLTVIIESTDSGTEHDYLFSPNSYYFTKGRRGIPIGNLTSQLFANIYLHEVDMYAKQTLKIKRYIRYMDDIIIFHDNKKQLQSWQNSITNFMYENLYLTVNPRKIRLYPTKRGVSFVGFVIYPNYLRLRGSSVKRLKRRYNKQLGAVASGKITPEVMLASFNAWKAHASHAKTKHLVESLESKQWWYITEYNKLNKLDNYAEGSSSYIQTSLFD